MTDRTKFGFAAGMGESRRDDTATACEACEAMCLDGVDGTLSAAEQTLFDRHMAGCVTCAEQFAEAKRGAAWMEMLKGHRPEPPAGMLQRILAQTSEAEMSTVFPRQGVPTPRFEVVPVAGKRENLWSWIEATFTFNPGQAHFQPRMAMTAAMAFFSIALTMNLSGIRLADLKPGAIQRTVGEARASMARSLQGYKVVYQVESRVNELRGDDLGKDPGGPFSREAVKPKIPAGKPAGEKPKQAPPQGTSELKPGADLQPVPSGSEKEKETATSAEAFDLQKGA